MKKYVLFILLLVIMIGAISCGVSTVRTGSSGNYNYSYDERDFNRYHWSPWQRAQWVQNHNGWILNVKKCTYHNQWNGQTFAMWFYDKKCENIYTAYQITPEMCHGENPKKFLWERGFRSIMYYSPSNIDVQLLTPNIGGFTRQEGSYIKSGTMMGPMKMSYNNGSSIANAPEPLSAEEIRAKYLEETKRALAAEAHDEDLAKLNNEIAKINEMTRVFIRYLELSNQTLTNEENDYFAWVVTALTESLRAEICDKTLWYKYPDDTIEHLPSSSTMRDLLKKSYNLKSVEQISYSKFLYNYRLEKLKAELAEKMKEEEKMKKVNR